jgi:thiamine biosynthesis lipoprotein ApbE
MRLTSLRRNIALGVAFLFFGSAAWLATAARPDAESGEYFVHHDHILGTSLDVWITAQSEETAEAAESAILAEIERLRRVFSLYDEASELSRLNRSTGPSKASDDLLAVLRRYDDFQRISSGAFSGQVGRLVELWKQAEKTQREPDAETLQRIVAVLRTPGWRIDEASHTVTRLNDQAINLNAIAKGYIIQKAAAAARTKGVDGLLLNLGGDMAAWGRDAGGRRGWSVGVQNPEEPWDNAEPIARLRLDDVAIATSGGYERYYTVAGKKRSHIFDPRTGRSADGANGATVIARDNVTANALATTLCVLTPAEGLKLVAQVPGAECLIVAKDGSLVRSSGLARYVRSMKPTSPEKTFEPVAFVQDKADTWPAGYQVNMTITIPTNPSGKYRRPYMAAWVENTDGKPVRTIAVWGMQPKWIPQLPQWWKFAKNDQTLVKAVSRATRGPGKYSLVWDGKDDKGNALPQGTYTVHVEVHREHGKLVRQTGKLDCLANPAMMTLDKNAETGDTLLEYAKKK